MAPPTTITARVSRVVDGDTIRVFLPNTEKDESLRILALDTEESNAGGSKPVTPWGKKAKLRAEAFFSPDDEVELVFPSSEDCEVCLKKYRGNYGRLLVFVMKDGVDFQETMIREGYSPYFMKYGNAQWEDLHKKYQIAEREAQIETLGVWDQIGVNGSEIRNYAALGTWWKLRAEIIDRYRAARQSTENLFNTRLDYDTLISLAEEEKEATVFTELRSIKKVGARSALILIGSEEQPFSLFLPDIESDEGQGIVRLLETRYIFGDAAHPRRSYAYVHGTLSLYHDKPQIVVRHTDQVIDEALSSK
ncbi:MAG: thermonuclease family protein [Chlorobiales bacterium]|nr:thermonuclease family protein [Chlorobiales bacterium]